MSQLAMKEAWNAGLVCLHPTDTLPGLSFRPDSARGLQNFLAIKQRSPDKMPIALAADWSIAERCWQALPKLWTPVLQGLWPAPLSVIWKASAACPKDLLAPDGTCSLRLPEWTGADAWMRDFLLDLGEAFPSSSVNHSGKAASASWAEAVAFLEPYVQQGLAYIPPQRGSDRSSPPSTLIKIHEDGTWQLLREGALPKARIESELKRHDVRI